MPKETSNQRPIGIKMVGDVKGVRVRNSTFLGDMDAIHLSEKDGLAPSDITLDENQYILGTTGPAAPETSLKKDLFIPVLVGVIVLVVTVFLSWVGFKA